jgi:hypothetical protein
MPEVTKATSSLYRAGDRAAVVVGTSLNKLQMRRILDAEHHQFFSAIEDAEAWLSEARAV